MLLLVPALLLPLAGCGLFGDPDPRDAAVAFLDALAVGDGAAAGALTDAPEAASAALDQVRAALEPTGVQARLDTVTPADDTATATWSATWELPDDRRWAYPGGFELARADTDLGWVVRWDPAVLHPELAAGQLVELRETRPDLAPVVDRDGQPVLTEQSVVTVALDPAAPDLPGVAASLATALGPLDPTITEQSVLAGVAAVPEGGTYPVAVLREDDYQAVRGQIYELAGVTFPVQDRLLGPDREFASQVLPGIREQVEEQLAGAAGWRIATVDVAGTEVAVLQEQPPAPAPRVTTTLSRSVQAAAEDALEPVPTAAMVVALQPSSGEVLAVAQNGAADAQGPLALTGRYPPGSTFKVVTAAAALQGGAVTQESPVACPATTVIEGRTVPNINLFELGTVPLRTALARSCNTTFAELAAGFAPDQLTRAALQMGVGADFDIPGMTTLTGEVPPSDSVVQRAENGFGQGEVLATPFGMALVCATVARGGELRTPILLRGVGTTVLSEPAPPVPRPVTDSLSVMMREVITQGSGAALEGQGDLHGKTGTAEYAAADGATRSHGWFMGFRGDLAFAVLVVDGESSAPAVDAAGRFLTAIGPG